MSSPTKHGRKEGSSGIEIDRDLRSMLPKDEPDTTFLYHQARLMLLIQRRVRPKKLAKELLNEMFLATKDMQERFNRL